MKLETAPELDSDEAVFLRSKSYSFNMKRNSSHCKHKVVQDDNKYNLEEYKYCLENKENKSGVIFTSANIKYETSMVKQKKTLNTFVDSIFFFDKINSVPWGYNLPPR